MNNKTISILALAVMVLALPAAVVAQDATEGAAGAADDLLGTIAGETDENAPPRWLSSIAFGGSLTSGNSDTLGLNLALGSERKTETHELVLGAVATYGEADDETTTEKGSLFFNYKRLFGSSYAYSDTELFRDKIALIDYRFNTSLGYGRYVIDNDDTRLGLEGGVAYIRESYGDPPDSDVEEDRDTDDRVALRVAQTFEHKLSGTARVWQSLEYLPEFSDFDNYLLNATVGVEAALNSTLSLRVSVEDRYNSQPPYDSDRNDLLTVAAVAARF
jgi:putative salt-induced outer membrane protein YdiY